MAAGGCSACTPSAARSRTPSPPRFIVKSLSKPEKASFLEFAPAYFSYMARSMKAGGRPTCLAKVGDWTGADPAALVWRAET